nr:tripartite motif-containing protein 2-like [Biomphalaria glabrata]
MYFLKRLTKSDTIFNKTELDQGKLWKKIGRKGQGRGQFDMPCGVTTTKSGDVIIADTENHRVQIFNFDGVFKSKFGSKGSKPSQLCYPMGVAVTSSEDVVVTDSVNAAIKLFSIDGTLKMCFTQQAAVEFPHGICVTIDDHIIFTDICKHSVTVLQPTELSAIFLANMVTALKNSIILTVSPQTHRIRLLSPTRETTVSKYSIFKAGYCVALHL